MNSIENDTEGHSPPVATQKSCQGGSAWIENRQLRIVTRGTVPSFLLEANSAFMSGNNAEALSLLREENLGLVRTLIDGQTHRVDLMYMLAKLFGDLGEFDQAEHWYRRIVEHEPNAVAFSLLSDSLTHSRARVSEGAEWAQRAVALEPDNPLYLAQLGRSLFDTGRVEPGLKILRQMVKRYPEDPDLLEGLLWRMHYVPDIPREDFLDGYRRWGQLISRNICAERCHTNDPDPLRRLRVGFISPDFRRNSVAYTFEPFLDGYGGQQMKIFAYANSRRCDDVTERLKLGFDHFRSICGTAPEQVAELIRQDEIDILVEIAGHARGHCLEVLAHKPAPIQVDLGGINTTGLSQVDYRIIDAICDPPNWSQPYVEKNINLPGGYFCFRPKESPLQVSSLPAMHNGYVTFAAFHGRHKLNEQTLILWGRILKQVENSRLLLKFSLSADKGVVDHLLEQCRKCNLDTDRIEFLDWPSTDEYLALYDRVDLALDAYPFNGGITTLEALWMGVPTVSLSGSTVVSRIGGSIMNRIGLDVFVASDPEEYVAKAVAFAGQLAELESIRQGLRELMLASPLCNAKRFADELTAAFRQMWVEWCKTRP